MWGISLPKHLKYHKSAGFESTVCITAINHHQTKNLSKATTIASYRVSHVLAKHKKPFKVDNIVKEDFLKTADSLFKDFKNKNTDHEHH